MVGESALDENITDPIDHYRIKTYIVILDILITQISERFNENLSPLYKDISLFQRKRLREVEKLSSSLPVDAFNAFEEEEKEEEDEEEEIETAEEDQKTISTIYAHYRPLGPLLSILNFFHPSSSFNSSILLQITIK
ncbi:hypothetical protein ACI65C_013464 [Semiaphis heraclei]